MAVSGLAEFGFELDRWFMIERGVEALGVVGAPDEGADVAAGLVEGREGFAVHSALSVFMKLSA